MNREPAARQLISLDVNLGSHARIQDLVDPCGGSIAENMTVAEESACIPVVSVKRNAH
jgi:hypothetical protein